MRNSEGITGRKAQNFAALRALLPVAAALVLLSQSACVKKTVIASGVPTVTFQVIPPASLQVTAQTQVIAIIMNDPKGLGIDWNASCVTTSCGAFAPTHTMSGQPTTYTAPSTVPLGGVNLTAKATAAPSQMIVATVTIFTNVAISFTQFPASPLGAGSTTNITAVVTGDPNNPPLGVGWSLNCGIPNCGTISAANTQSGAPLTYTAPATVTTSFTVQIVATPLADPTKLINVSITVNPATSNISIAFSVPFPPGNLQGGMSAMMAATVTNDAASGGVDWNVTCTNTVSAGQCGTFTPTPAHTASGSPISYMAPAINVIPANGLMVTITAASHTNPTVTITAVVNVTTPTLSISITKQPPSSLSVGLTAVITATVLNDSPTIPNGVDWTVTCTPGAGGNCGSFSLLHTDGTGVQTTTYTAPTVIPGGNPPGVVTITATSSAQTAKTATATVTITPSTAISIAFDKAPPTTMLDNGQANMSAKVTNDPLTPPNGVDWTVTCTPGTGGDCGSFNPAHTANDVQTIYMAPAVLPANSTVTITATSTAQHSATISQAVTITAPVLTVMITTAPTTLEVGTPSQVSATVTNDGPPPNGVDWSCTASDGGNCGSFNPTHTASAMSSTYTAPTAVPGNGGTVIITARSTSNSAISMSTSPIPITPNANAGFLQGQYAFTLSGTNASGTYTAAGSIVADGAGHITSGEEDAASVSCTGTSTTVTGNYVIGPDGRGTMTLTTNQMCFGNGGATGVQSLSFAIVGNAKPAPSALLTELDGAVGSGQLALQDTTDIAKGMGAISGSYAFVFNGSDQTTSNANSQSTTNFGGVFNVSGNMLNFTQDINDQGTGTVMQGQAVAFTFTTPDSFGRSTATAGQTVFAFYVVNAGQVNFIEQDALFVAIGTAYSQGTFATGPYAFTFAGLDGAQGSQVVAGGTFTAGASTLTNGIIDVNDGSGLIQTGPNGTPFTGTVTAATNGRGTLTLTGTPTGISKFAFYPTANNGVLLCELDANFTSIGAALPQASGITTATFTGNYALNLTNDIQGATFFPQDDGVGQLNSDGVATLMGTVDFASGGNIYPGSTLMGNFAVSASAPGRFTGAYTLMLNSTTMRTLNEFFYVVNPNTVLFVQSGIAVQTSGILQLQHNP
jgi:hypothetical protein